MASRTEESKPRDQAAKQPQQPERGMTPHRGGGSMAPYSRDPFHLFRENMNRLFERFFTGSLAPYYEGGMEHDGWGLDVREEEGAVVVRAEAPGFEPGDFDVQVRGDQLILSATHKAETEEKERGYREWRRHELYRAVPLPAGVDREKVDAEYRHGVLTVKVPLTEQAKGKRVQVKG